HAPPLVRLWFWIVAPVVLLLIAAVMVLYLWTRTPAVPVVEAVTQISDDGVAKWIYTGLQTDGSRIYFNEGTVGSLNVAQVSVTGGATSIIGTKLPNAQVVGLAPEGSPLLALLGPFTYVPKAVWLIPLPAGEPRRLRGIEANWAVFTSDGRILFSNPGILYVAERHGSSPRKLLNFGNSFVGEPTNSPHRKRSVGS